MLCPSYFLGYSFQVQVSCRYWNRR